MPQSELSCPTCSQLLLSGVAGRLAKQVLVVASPNVAVLIYARVAAFVDPSFMLQCRKVCVCVCVCVCMCVCVRVCLCGCVGSHL